MVECQLPKLDVVGSNPIARSGTQVLARTQPPAYLRIAARSNSELFRIDRVRESRTIDGKLVNAAADEMTLHAAQDAGITIPTLCHLQDVSEQILSKKVLRALALGNIEGLARGLAVERCGSSVRVPVRSGILGRVF